MSDIIHIGLWDIILIAVVSIQATVVAYLYQPKWKALVYGLPLPFITATLAVGGGVNITCLAGTILLLIFTHQVRIMHYNFKIPIIPAIIISALCYCTAGSILMPVLPRTEIVFWGTLAAEWLLAIFLYSITPHKIEPGHRSPLPIWLKLPIIICVISFLIIMKSRMQGFIALFPMVGVITAYEARCCLWTISRQTPVLMLTLFPLILVCRLNQSSLGVGWGLALGWSASTVVLVPFTYFMWRNDNKNTSYNDDLDNSKNE